MLHHALNLRIPFQMNFHVKSVFVRAIASPLYYFLLYINDLGSQASYLGQNMSDIDILLCADDLAMLANSREELQDKLNLLHLYCKGRNLHVNINKSKTLLFNAVKDTRPITYNDFKLDEVNSLKYLGMTINYKANLQYSHQISIQQALKAKA